MSQREDAIKNFETGRIKALQEERLHIQKKTFTKWMNSFLLKARMEVEDLFTDLADGRMLLKLLEIISGEKLGKPNNGRMRVHKIENVNKSLAFLHTKVRLESIGAEDIVDGNPRLILGLIWTIILRFQIQEIEIDVDEENESSEKKSAKDALLLWCQRKTNGYSNVNIQDFTGSWRSGLGFNALIHAHRPDLIDFDRLNPSKHIDNLNNAFDVAETSLGIPRLLDAEDIDTAKPDEKSVLTYVASYYHTFAQMYNKDKSGRRIVNIVRQIKEADDLKSTYEHDGKALISWIRVTIEWLNSRDFPNNLEGVQKLLQKFTDHITVQKPPRYNEKSEIEANYFILNTRLKELNQHLYVPPEGLLVQDLEKAWEQLEKAEYLRELALREEVIRQTNLEQLAIRFEKKSLLREGYMKDMIQVLSDPRYGINLTQVEATLKKHEAISADILAREQRCEQLVTMADYLVKENYHDCAKIADRAAGITKTWNELINLLDTHKANLEKFSSLMQMMRDIDTLLSTIQELEENFGTQDVGVHLIGVEDLLQKHSLVESQISAMGDTIKRLGKQSANFEGKEREMIQPKIANMNSEYSRLQAGSKERRNKLEERRAYFQFVQDHEEEEAWVNEKSLVCGQGIVCKDLRGVLNLIGAHKMLLDEIKARRGKIGKVKEKGNELVAVWEKEQQRGKAAEITDVRERIKSLEAKWGGLGKDAEGKSRRLAVVLEAFQFYSDANETDSWVTEKRPLVASTDYGEDEPSAQALLQRHLNLEEEITAYENDVKGLNAQADKLVKAGINSIQEMSESSATTTPAPPPVTTGQQHHHQNGHSSPSDHNSTASPAAPAEDDVEYVTEQKLVPQEYFEDEVVEKTDYKTVTEERAVPQVKALYAFQGQDIEIKKGEVMFLLNKTNSDWWNVRKANGEDGFVPANYVKEVDPKVVMVQVRKPEVIRETTKVKKTRMVLQDVTKPVPRKPVISSSTGTLKKSSSTASVQQTPSSQTTTTTTATHPSASAVAAAAAATAEPILTRTDRINKDYTQIIDLSGVRKQNLQESIKLHQFLRECDDFEKWIVEKRKYLETPDVPNVQAAKRAFEQFLTDLTASSSRVSQIETLVEQFEKSGTTQGKTIDVVRERASKIRKMYEELLKLKSGKEKTLEGALSVELFNRTCEEVQDWMEEKMMQIDTDEWSNDLKTVQALQRRHNNVERELAPIQEKVSRVSLLAESVKKSYPNETENVDERNREVVSRWQLLKDKAHGRKDALENAVGLQIFVQGTKNLLHWIDGVKDRLNAYVPSRDVSSAEDALKAHGELGDDIKSKQHEFEELSQLGAKIQNCNRDVQEKLELLAREKNAIATGYAEKTDWLNQVLDLQMFLREADHIDSATRNQLSLVSSQELGSNLDEVESLLKRHTDTENTLVAQDERMRMFDAMGGKLVEAGHFEQKLIQERRRSVAERREQVKELAKKRKTELNRSQRYHEFCNDVEETSAWVKEKIEVAQDDSFKDLANVVKKIQKHEAFAGEVRANEVRIKNINRAGDTLQTAIPEKEREIRDAVKQLNGLWEQLVLLSAEKADKLRQAEAQAGFNKNLDAVVDRLASIKSNVNTECAVNDRRSCKDAVKRANSLSTDLAAVESKIGELERVADDMEKENHFDRARIRNRVEEAKDLMSELKAPVDNLKRELDDKYSYYSFLHELDAEASWISEKRALVEQQTTIHDLYQAQTIHKKHQKLEQEVLNREPIVTRLLERGKEHVLHEHVAGKLEVFRGQWEALKAACTDKSKRLDLALKSQQFFFDAGEIVNWMSMKEDALTTPITSKDIHSAVKLLTKQKTLELEMDSYSGIVQEMKHMANAMVSAGHPDRALISAKSNALDDHMSLLRRIANERREKLIHAVHTLEYLQEADEFLKYIDEVFGREVGSNEFGQDYEHLQILQARFKDVELKVEGVNDRFKTLEEMGRKLDHHQGGGGLPASTNSTDEVAVSGSEIGERTVAQTSEELREKWNTMLSLMAAREQKLHAAGEIHAFNRDVSDAIARIQEKLTSISDTVGRDVNSCESMLRENEAFETDLLALEAQLQVLVDDASRLQSLYPSNAQNIREEQAIVIESWNNLQTKATLRKDQLQNAVDFWRLSAEYGSSTAFINSLLTTMPSQPKVRDTASSQALMSEHEMIKGEIDAREDQFTRVFQLGQVMVEENHPESAENVSKMLANLRHLKEKLLVTWETKKVYLDQLIDLNIFLRDAKQLETVCNSQETQLGNLDLGDSVDEAYKAKKKHEAFEKLIQTQDEKFRLLDSQGKKLVKQHHFDSETVNQRLAEVAAAREKVKALSATKREAIKQKLKLVRFVRDVLETTAWVDEKVKKLKSGSDQSPATGNSGLNLQDKIKKLKKHQSLSAEISSNKSRVEDLFRTAKELRAEQEVRELRDRWAELCDLMVTHNKGLEEAYDILEFTNQCEQTIAWVREKESLVHAGDTGNDYEHCTEIIKRLDDVDSGIKVDDQRIKGLNLLADKLISVTGDTDGVIGRTREGLNDRWVALKGNLENYRVKLNQALETHKYNRDAEEVEERIGSKLPQLQVTDVGRDLEHVEALNRKQDAIEAQVHAVAQRVKDLETEKSRLIDELGVDESLLKTLESQWLEVSEATLKRRDALTSSLEYHKFLKKFTDLARYVQHVQDKLANKQLGGNVQEAENAAKRHRELRAEVNARDPLFAEVVKIGKRHIVEKHEYSTEFGKRVSELEEMRSSLGESLAAMETKLNQSLQQQRLFAKIHEIEQEIEFQESSLNRSDLGESLGAVTLLVRNHEEFTKQFGGIEAKVSEVIAEGEALIQPGHFDGPAISRRCADVTSKLERLKAKARDRAEKLHQSYELHKFVLEINEVESYELEKLKIATDDNYSDMSNLQSKIQRHAAFESEVIANEPRLTVINDRAEKLLSNLDDESNSLHSFMVQIGDRLEGIHTIWKELLASTALKGFRLQESYQALLFNQNLDDIELWMDELENQLESEDHGTDLDSVDALINKWKHLESEFEHKAEVIASVAATAEAFTKAKHYMADEIVERVQKIRSRYTSMSEPLHIRRENLDETLKFYEFLRDVGEEVGWVEERGPAVSVDADLGANLTQVQTLSKKHNQLESEIISHEPLIASLQTRASGMVKLGHFASDQITEKVQSLADKFRELKDSAALRRIRLADSFQSQMFYDEANELLLWMGEKATYTRNVECKEHENVSGLLKRMEAFQRDVANFKARIERVQKTGEELIARNHFDSENIQKKIAEVTHEYSELQKTSDRKRNRLLDAQKFYEFNRVCNETVDWINEQMNIAGSEEYGRDLEHCEQILQKFESFMGNVQESRAGVVQNLADELAAEGYQEEKIGQKAAEVKAMWEEFKELAAARLEALQGAKQVHSFDRIADETIAWINEKYAVVCSEDFGHDLESIQGLIRRHQVFENDLKPVEAKVNEVKSEADRLRNLFVDASEHVNVKLQACEEAWRGLIEKTRNRGDKLHQAADLQAYFDKYTELTAFVNELVAKVTSGELGRTVPAAEASLAKNNGYARQIESFRGVSEFVARGNQLVSQGHFMGEEIGERIKTLSARWEYLKNVTRERNELFTRNLDLRVYLAQLDEFERWLASKEPELRTLKLGESIAEVENLISEHEEWTHTLEAQESRVDLLRRRTLIEQAWEELRRREEAERELQAKRAEKERAEMLKRKEVERITQEINRKREDSDKDQQAHHNHQHGKEGKSGGGLLGSTRFGSFFGRDHGRRGSEPSSPTSTDLVGAGGGYYNSRGSSTNNSPTKLQLSITPPASLEHVNASQQQQQQNAGGDATAQPQLLSRSESLRLLNTTSSSLHPDATDTLKKPKRTPSFTTRRRTASFRNKKKHPENLPPTENEGYLERKHELQAGGKRAAVRSWKRTYVVLCGQLLCFFKDQEDFEMSKVGSSSPINVYQARCEVAVDYTKRKFVFRVKPTDGSEFLFAADAKEIMDEWVQKINFHAALEPKNQLDPMQQQQLQDGSNPGGDASQQHQSMMPPPPPPPKRMSEYSSTDEDDENQQQAQHHHHTRKPKPRNLQQQQPRSREPIYANHHEDTPLETDSVRSTTGKPPIPPRGDTAAMMPKKVRAAAADVPPRTSSLTASSGDLVPPPPPVNGRSPVMKQQQNGGAQDTVDNQQYFVTPPQRPVSVDRIIHHARFASSYSNSSSNGGVVVQQPPPPPPPYGLYPHHHHHNNKNGPPPPPAPLPRTIIQGSNSNATTTTTSTFKPHSNSSSNNNSASVNNRVLAYQQQQYHHGVIHSSSRPPPHHHASSSLSRDFIPITVTDNNRGGGSNSSSNNSSSGGGSQGYGYPPPPLSSSGANNNNHFLLLHHQQQQVHVARGPASPGGGVVHPLPSLHATAAMSPRSSGSLPPGMTLLGSPSPNASFLHGGDQSSSENEQGFHSSSPSPSPHAGGAPPQQQQTTDNPDPHHQATSSSSSSKKSKNKSGKHHHNKDESDAAAKDKESGGLMGLFRRKKATQL